MKEKKKRKSYLFLGAWLCNFVFWPSLSIGCPVEQDFFPVSVWYGGGKARAPMLEAVTPQSPQAWKKDLEQIKNLGFNTVRCWVEWTKCEPVEGKYDFSGLELLADLADKAGLRLIVQVYIDSAPDWVGKKYPDSKFVASNGLVVESQAAPGFCFDHPAVRDKILRFFAEAARVVRDKPAFLGWDLWSEPHIINWAEIYHLGNMEYLQFCYCPSSIARFREWLKAKYGTLAELNRAWYRTFESWEQVEPPRFGTILTYTDFVDWKTYISDKLAEDLAMKAKAVKAVIPRGITTSHSAIPGLFTKPIWSGTPDDRKMAGVVDYYGVSIYPKHAWTVRPWSPFFRAAGNDFVRSMNWKNGGFYVGELQAGHGVFGMKVSLPVTGADLQDWMWSMVACGARALNIYAYYPMISGYEAGGYGLVELDGKLTERAVAAGRIARIITDNMDLFLRCHPPPSEVAILYNPLSQLVGGQQTYTGEGQPIGVHNLSESLQGIHRAFFERNIPVDFLHVLDLQPEKLGQYRLLIVPFGVMMSGSDIKKIIAYIENGGVAVIEARCGWVDERGFSSAIIPGGGLHEVLGCRESYLRPIEKTSTLKITKAHEALPLLQPGEKLETIFFEEGFKLLNQKAQVLAEYDNGEPAIVLAPHGKGKAMIIGSFLGSAYHHFKNPNNGKFWAGLFNWLKLSCPLEVKVIREDPESLVEGRILEGENECILFVFNRGQKEAEVELALSLPSGNYQAWDLETKEKIQLRTRERRTFLSKTFDAGEIWVVALKLMK